MYMSSFGHFKLMFEVLKNNTCYYNNVVRNLMLISINNLINSLQGGVPPPPTPTPPYHPSWPVNHVMYIFKLKKCRKVKRISKFIKENPSGCIFLVGGQKLINFKQYSVGLEFLFTPILIFFSLPCYWCQICQMTKNVSYT